MNLRFTTLLIILATPTQLLGQNSQASPETPPPVSRTSEDSSSLEIIVEPKTLILGELSSAKVSVRTENPDCKPLGDMQIRLHTNVGALSALEGAGQGEYVAHYLLPDEYFPQYAVITAAAQCKSGPVNEWIVVPLFGTGEVVVKSRPGTLVTLNIDKSIFGPVKTDKRGQAAIPITAAPGIRTGVAGERIIDLDLPPMNRIAAMVDKEKITAGSDQKAIIRIYAITENGEPFNDASFRLVADRGVISEVQRVGNGTYLAEYQPPDKADNGRTTVSVLADMNEASVDEVVFEIEAPPKPVVPATQVADLSAETEVEPVNKPYNVAILPQAGFLTNFGHLHSPYFVAEIDIHLRFIVTGLSFLLDGGYYFSSQEFSESNQKSSVYIAPITGAIAYRFSINSRFQLFGAAGAGVHLTWNRTEHIDAYTIERNAVIFGFFATLGAAMQLGPGQVTLQARYIYAQASKIEELSGSIGGLTVLAGYRYEVF
ncbi:MAG: porin family protein [Proteobacteria bacterium]|nr:porin family protein [Pseudomonadota bacterium]